MKKTRSTKTAKTYNTRVCVPEPMPPRCPHCGSTESTVADGTWRNLNHRKIYRGRVCKSCGFSFVSSRIMTESELSEA